MRESRVWKFIATNVVSLVSVVTGVVVIVLHELGLLPDRVLSSIILALLVLLATSELIEKNRRLSELDERLEDMSGQLTDALQGMRVQTFSSTAEVLEYLTKRTRAVRQSVDQASIDHWRSRMTPKRATYNQTREELILADRVKYRYIGVLYSKRRLEFARRCSLEAETHRFFAGFYPRLRSEFPLMNFVVFDREEVLARYPYEPGQEKNYVLITSPHIAQLFVGYFERLWALSKKLHTEEDYRQLLEQIVEE